MITGARTSYQLDKQMGRFNEELLLPTLRKSFNTTIRKGGEYEKFDFIDERGVLYELKSRRCRKNTYPTTLLPKHKVLGKEQYFIFRFTDKVCYIKFDAAIFATFEVQDLIDGRFAYGEPIEHYKIPIELLVELL
jgi:hypothetical protein